MPITEEFLKLLMEQNATLLKQNVALSEQNTAISICIPTAVCALTAIPAWSMPA